MTEDELNSLRKSVNRGCPYGESNWVAEVMKLHGIEMTNNPRGRPKKGT